VDTASAENSDRSDRSERSALDEQKEAGVIEDFFGKQQMKMEDISSYFEADMIPIAKASRGFKRKLYGGKVFGSPILGLQP